MTDREKKQNRKEQRADMIERLTTFLTDRISNAYIYGLAGFAKPEWGKRDEIKRLLEYEIPEEDD